MSAARQLATCIEGVQSVRPVPLIRETFTVYAIKDNGDLYEIERAETFDAARRHLDYQPHKQTFAIARRNVDTGAVTLHVYRIKKQARAVKVYADYQTRSVNPTYAEHLHDIRLPAGFASSRSAQFGEER